MLFAKNDETIESKILETLQYGPARIPDLVEKIKVERFKTTKQGVYYAIRQLKKAEIVVAHKKLLSLNAIWVKRINEFSTLAEHYYVSPGENRGHFLHLKDGEKIQYSFKNPIETDVFWNHALLQIGEITGKAPFFAYGTHIWFYIAHPENELELKKYFVSQGRQYLLAVGYDLPLNRIVKTYMDGELSQCDLLATPIFPKDNYCLNVVEDFMIEVWIDPDVVARIHQFYLLHDTYSNDVRKEFRKIVEGRGKTKLVISRNRKKAERLKKRLAKSFWLKSI